MEELNEQNSQLRNQLIIAGASAGFAALVSLASVWAGSIITREQDAADLNETRLNAVALSIQNAEMITRSITMLNPAVTSDMSVNWYQAGYYGLSLRVDNNGELPLKCELLNPGDDLGEGRFAYTFEADEIHDVDPGTSASWLIEADGDRLEPGQAVKFSVNVECSINELIAGQIAEMASEYIRNPDFLQDLQTTAYPHIYRYVDFGER